MNKEIVQARKALDKAHKLHDQIVSRVQRRCKHPNVGEHHTGYTYIPNGPPTRVCLDCGYGEQGWGFIDEIGYKDPIRKLSGKSVLKLDEQAFWNALVPPVKHV